MVLGRNLVGPVERGVHGFREHVQPRLLLGHLPGLAPDALLVAQEKGEAQPPLALLPHAL
jgi:hypothetical protein